MDTIDELGRRAARTALAEAEAYTDVDAGLARILADDEDVELNADGGSRRGWVVVLAAAAAVVAAVTAGVVWSQDDPSPRLVPGTPPEVTPAPTIPVTPEPTTPATAPPPTPTPTTSPSGDPSSPLATLAEAIGASTAIAREPGKVIVFADGTTTEVATPRNAYVQTDGAMLWWDIVTGETTNRSAAATLDGTVVCEVEGSIHRVRQDPDGGYVASVERAIRGHRPGRRGERGAQLRRGLRVR